MASTTNATTAATAAALPSPPQDERYADPCAVAEYVAHDGREVLASTVVDASVSEAFDAWLQDVWLAYKKNETSLVTRYTPQWMNYSDVEPGQGRGLVGHARLVPLGVVEQIISAGEPDERDAQLIPSISYKLRKFGPFALKDHIGLVRFVAESPSSTRVVWSVKVTATTLGNVLLCGGAVTRLVMRAAFEVFLSTFTKALRDRKRSK